jgi:hypothetical protein
VYIFLKIEIMKKSILFILTLTLGAMIGCEPITGNEKLGAVLDPSQIKIRVENPGGGNKVTLINETPGVTGQWDYQIGVAVGDEVTVVMPFTGEVPVKFTAFCDGGLVTAETTANITKADTEVDEFWTLLAGTEPEGKTWVWDPTPDKVIYGTAGYLVNKTATWSTFKMGATVMGDKVVTGGEEMVFDLTGGANFTKRKTGGEVVEKGRFGFNRESLKTGDGAQWSVVKLLLSDASVILGSLCWTTTPIYSYDILELTEDTMVLCAAVPGSGAWAEGTYWHFKTK